MSWAGTFSITGGRLVDPANEVDDELDLHIAEGRVLARYDAASYMGHDPVRPRRLLLHRKEIVNLTSQTVQKGFTLIPLRLYIKDSYAKLEIAIARGKRHYDKREAIAERDSKRRLDRVIKTRPVSRKRNK